MPTPTKAIIFNNVNLINNAKWAYEMIKNVNPNVEMIVSLDIQMTASIEYADVALPANSWLEFEGLEITASCSNPFLQIWKGGIPPVFDSRDDLTILAGIANALAQVTGEGGFRDHFTFAAPKQRGIYIQRLLDTCTTTAGFKLDEIMAGKWGPPGGSLLNFRTYPRIPFYEQIHDSEPFHTDTGRLHAYADIPEAIEYGRQVALEQGERDKEFSLGERLSILLPHAEDAPPGPQRLVERGLAHALRLEFRRPLPPRQARTYSGRAPASYQPSSGPEAGYQRRRLRLCGRQPR
jgi:hypothetical protein